MHHVNLDLQGEAVQQFVRALVADPEGAIVETHGRAVARLVPIGKAASEPAHLQNDWTRAKNARRCFLIDREIDGTLTPEEAAELECLQRQMLAHLDRVAPLPLEATRRLYEALLAKAEAAGEA